jgi:hypothetical protein
MKTTTSTIRKYQIAIIVLSLTTLLSTTMIFSSFSGSPVPPAPAGGKSQITKEKAKGYMSSYKNSATPLNSIAEGVVIERDQLEAINSLDSLSKTVDEDVNVGSFRVYFGKDEVGADVSVVVAVDDDGTDMTGTIYSTARNTGGLCPPMCDATGTLTGE